MTFDYNKHMVVFSNLMPVAGSNNFIICDLHRNTYYNINELCFKIVVDCNYFRISKICDFLSIDIEVVEKYLEILVNNDIIFFTETPKFYPKLDLTWSEPYDVTNMIIDVSKTNHDIDSINTFIGNHRIHTIQVRFFDIIDISYLLNLLNLFKLLKVSSYELLIPFADRFLDGEFIKDLAFRFPRLANCILYNSPEEKSISVHQNNFGRFFYTKSRVYSDKCCGKILPDFFIINYKNFTEGLRYNTCLNRKISIDSKSLIKNCPSFKENYGSIENLTISDILLNEKFKSLWGITKDKITKCKDCEFRYICTDCRAYVEDPNDILSKPLKCGYNPYTGIWEDWSKNPLKQQAMDFYGIDRGEL